MRNFTNNQTQNEIIENKYGLDEKKQDIQKLKQCASFYKSFLLGKRFLILFNDGNYIELLFKKTDFKHLTGVSSKLNAEQFYNKCIGIKAGKSRIYISPDEIYTTEKHPHALAIKKMRIFHNIYDLFINNTYLLEDITTESKSYYFGLADLKLSLFCEECDKENNYLTAISLREKSYLSKSKKYYHFDYVFVKTNVYLKYEHILFPDKIDYSYFKRNENKLKHIINYDLFIHNFTESSS